MKTEWLCPDCGETDPKKFYTSTTGRRCKKCQSRRRLANYDKRLKAAGKRPRMPFMRGIGFYSPEDVLQARKFGLRVKDYLEAKNARE
jgi:hypothetical protein